MKFYILVYIFTIVSVGLMAGLFYNWSFNITTGLAKLDDRTYLSAMQIFNKTILNPAFFFIFLGSILAFPILTFIQGNVEINLLFWLILSAMVIYMLGSIGVTFLGNIPLNNKLEAINLVQLNEGECLAFRKQFETRWNTLNLIRTGSSVISFVILLIASFIKLEI